MTFIVGLTGGIGSGKSTIADYFAELGVPIVDADIVARQVVEKGTPLLAEIAKHFGNDILTPQGELDRAKLRQIIFADADEKHWLNNLMHPAIRAAMLSRLSAVDFPYVLWVVPLLIENQLTDLCQRVLVIDVAPEIQLKRAAERDQSHIETIKSIMQSQVNRETRLSYADDIIENNLPLSENKTQLKQQVQHLHQTYLTLARQEKNPV